MASLPLHALVLVVEHLPTPIVVMDGNGLIVGASPSAIALLGDGPTSTTPVGEHLHDHLASMPFPPRVTDPTAMLCEDGEHALVGLLDRFERIHVPADVGALAGEVAHDFNNLLGVIINFASLAAADLSPGTAGERDLREVIVAAKRGAVITQRLLDVGIAGHVDGHQTDPREAVNARFRKAFPTDFPSRATDGDAAGT